jgi:glycosyltransferase involved in cell wall biosynthesis
MFLNQVPKLAKGFIRLGNDVRCCAYNSILKELSPFKSRKLSKALYKTKADDILVNWAKNYKPDICILSGFPKSFDLTSINRLREVIPNTVFVVIDGDPWPKLNPGRIETATRFDILAATNDGQWLQDYRDAGVPKCIFMPNWCDPDIEHHYDVDEKWQTDILWTGTAKHHIASPEKIREELVLRLMKKDNVSLYGCFDRPKIGGLDYLYAISGAKIGAHINAANNVRMYHSDRLTYYMAGGTFVLSKRVPDSERLAKDGLHLKYFDEVDEFFDLANWYIDHESERRKIADAGMNWAHEQFNCVKIAGYILDVIEKGEYKAPWNDAI